MRDRNLKIHYLCVGKMESCTKKTCYRNRENSEIAGVKGKKKNPELEIVIQLRGEGILARLNEIIEKRIMEIYKKHSYAKIRIEVLG